MQDILISCRPVKPFRIILAEQLRSQGGMIFYWHRSMIWFSGWLGTPKLKYNAAVWTIFPTQQTLIYGQIQYELNKHFKFLIGCWSESL